MQIESVQIEFLSCDEWQAELENHRPEDLIISKVSRRFSMIQNKSTCMEVRTGGGEFLNIPASSCVIYPPQTMQYCKVVAEAVPTTHIRWLYMDVILNEKYSFTDLFELPYILPEKYNREMEMHFSALLTMKADEKRFCERISIAYKIVQILMDVSMPKPKTVSSVLKAIAYIRENYTRAVTVAELSDVAGMSVSNFFRVFKKQTGVSPVTYLNDYRLLKGSVLLETTELRVGDIAAQIGFKEQYYFSRLFLKRFGVSPLKYRKTAENSIVSK